ncbi:hypothetical protein ENBRE01_2239 [Enteropsectra breve]|nr:hypothetical protein ENBRE01_2239 [Enteropsectra breve]
MLRMLAINALLSIGPILGTSYQEKNHFLQQTYCKEIEDAAKQNSNPDLETDKPEEKIDILCETCSYDLREDENNIRFSDEIDGPVENNDDLKPFKDLNPNWLKCPQCKWIGHIKCNFMYIAKNQRCLNCCFTYHRNIQHILLFELLMIFVSKNTKTNFFEFCHAISPELKSISVYEIIQYGAKIQYLIDHSEVSRILITYLTVNKAISEDETYMLSEAFILGPGHKLTSENVLRVDSSECEKLVDLANFERFLSNSTVEIILDMLYPVMKMEFADFKLLYLEQLLEHFMQRKFPLTALEDTIESMFTTEEKYRSLLTAFKKTLVYLDEEMITEYYRSSKKLVFNKLLIEYFSESESTLRKMLKVFMQRKRSMNDWFSPFSVIKMLLEKDLKLNEEETLETNLCLANYSNGDEDGLSKEAVRLVQLYLKKRGADLFDKVSGVLEKYNYESLFSFVFYAMPATFFDTQRICNILNILIVDNDRLFKYAIDILFKLNYLNKNNIADYKALLQTSDNDNAILFLDELRLD